VALNFPDNPTINQIFSDATSGFYYKWDGTVWQSFAPGSSANIQILDDISSQFNGITTSFSLTSGGTSVVPIKSAQLVINLGGIVQDPSDDYFVSGSTISFSEPPETGLSFSGISLGPAIPISNILDGSIFPQDLSTGAPWWLSDYKVGIGTSVPTSLLDVEGDAIIAGILTATNISVTGIITANSIIAGAVGTSQTSLVVQGNARITGILTVGTGSITLNGSTNNITGISSITDTSNRKLVALASGVKVLYYEATAPVGWTKVTSHNDKCLRVVSGTGGGSGGTTAFTSVFTSRTPSGSVSGSNSGGSVANTTATGSVSGTNSGGSVTGSVSGSNSGGSVTGSVSGSNSGGSVNNTTLSESQIPSHTHLIFDQTGQPGSNQAGTRYGAVAIFDNNAGAKSTDSTGGSTAHNHGFTNPSWSGSWTQGTFTNPSWSGSWTQGTFTNPSWSGSISINAHNHSLTQPTWSGSFTGSAMNFAVQYIDMILCSFD
jgi:hypothetical protein